MVPRENKNNAYAKFGGTNKEYYGIFRSGLFSWIINVRTACVTSYMFSYIYVICQLRGPYSEKLCRIEALMMQQLNQDRGHSFSLYRPKLIDFFPLSFPSSLKSLFKLLTSAALDSECSIEATHKLNVSKRNNFI